VLRHAIYAPLSIVWSQIKLLLLRSKVTNRPFWSRGWCMRWLSRSSTHWSHGRVSSASVESQGPRSQL